MCSYPGQRLRERLTVYIFVSILRFFLKGVLVSLSFKGFGVCKLAQGCNFLFLWLKFNFYSLDLELFCICKSSKNLVGLLPFSLIYRSPMIKYRRPLVRTSQSTLLIWLCCPLWWQSSSKMPELASHIYISMSWSTLWLLNPPGKDV